MTAWLAKKLSGEGLFDGIKSESDVFEQIRCIACEPHFRPNWPTSNRRRPFQAFQLKFCNLKLKLSSLRERFSLEILLLKNQQKSTIFS